ncbi:hypothetical protein D3C72_2370400 [compost metagenome]
MPLNCMCSMMALMGAKPVPEASRISGSSLSSRRKKPPYGPSMRRMSFSFIALNTWSVNLPPGMWRRCSSRPGCVAWVWGALAME